MVTQKHNTKVGTFKLTICRGSSFWSR
ncbi:MAG: hypothetical protein ACLUOJ_02355 [Streptococcus salivarius]